MGHHSMEPDPVLAAALKNAEDVIVRVVARRKKYRRVKEIEQKREDSSYQFELLLEGAAPQERWWDMVTTFL